LKEATAVSPTPTASTFADRLRYRLQDMLANPYSFLPSYQQRYETMLQYITDTLTPHQAYAMTFLMGGDVARLYQDMPSTAQLQFPHVNAMDLTAQTGWYYFAGTCTAEDGKEYGILCMFFRYMLLPPPIARHFGLSDVENQIVDLQLSMCVDGGRFYQIDPPVVSGVSGEIRVSDKLFLVAGNNSVQPLFEDVFPMRVRAAGTDRGEAKPVELAIDLLFPSGGHYFLHGDDGAVPLVAGLGTRYYSIQNIPLDVAASSITYDGRVIRLKSGTFWFDHQWGTGMVPNAVPRFPVMRAAGNLGKQNPQGWDFFPSNLEEGRSICVSALHTSAWDKFVKQTGENPPGTLESPVTGKYMDQYGTLFNISGLMRVPDWRKTNHTPNGAKYSNIGTWVPHLWEFEFTEKVVPEKFRELAYVCISDDAQALFFANGTQYVEAAVRVYNVGAEVVGQGFGEAVGYVDPTRTALGLAGIPVAEPTIELFTAKPPTLLMKLLSYLYLRLPGNTAALKSILACASIPPGPRPLNCG
jgi:hypothetical protein